MNKAHLLYKVIKWMAIVVAVPVVLFLTLAMLLYAPPVQNFVVGKVAEKLSEKTGMHVAVQQVKLAFPLDLAVHGVTVLDTVSAVSHTLAEHGVPVVARDTLADIRVLRLNVAVRPLLEGRAEVKGVELYDARVDTKSYVPDVHARGVIGMLKTNTDVVFDPPGRVVVDGMQIGEADVYVALSDTAREDTTQQQVPWDVDVSRLSVEKSKICVSMGQDDVRVRLAMQEMTLGRARVTTAQLHCRVQDLRGKGIAASYVAREVKKEGTRGNAAWMQRQVDAWDVKQQHKRGFDPTNVKCEDVAFSVASLVYTPDGAIQVDIPALKFKEHGGLCVNEMVAKGELEGKRVKVERLKIITPHSQVNATADFPLTLLEKYNGGVGHVNMDAVLGWQDVHLLAAPWVEASWTDRLPKSKLTVRGKVDGGMAWVKLQDTYIDWQGVATVAASGSINHPCDKSRSGQIKVSAEVEDGRPIMAWLPADVQRTLAIPSGTRLSGTAGVDGDKYDFAGDLNVLDGQVVLDAKISPAQYIYKVGLDAKAFPISALLPTLGLGQMTGTLSAEGRGFDPLSEDAQLSASVDVKHLDWQSTPLGQCKADVSLQGKVGEGEFWLQNDYLCGDGSVAVDLRERLCVTLDGDFDPINVQKVAQMKDTLLVSTSVHLEAYTDTAMTDYGVKGHLAGNRIVTAQNGFMAKDIDFAVAVNPAQATLSAEMGDMAMDAKYQGAVGDLLSEVMALKDELVKQSSTKDFNQEQIRQALPALDLTLNIGTDNPVSNFLRTKGYDFAHCSLDLTTNNHQGINGQGRLTGLQMEKVQLEDIGLRIGQNERGITLDVEAENKGETYEPKFSSMVHGYLYDEDAGVDLTVWDQQGELGIDLGVKAAIEDGGLRASFSPEYLILGYRFFTLNQDNYLYLGKAGTIGADIQLTADDGSSLSLFSMPDTLVNDLTLSLNNFEIGKLGEFLPFLPKMQGNLAGDVHLIDDHTNVSAMGTIGCAGFEYEGVRLGDVGLEAVYMPKEGGEHHFNAFLSTADTEVLALEGVYYDERNGYFEGQADMTNFPLPLLNGFLVETDFALKGNAGGTLSVEGNLANPKLEGALHFDQAHLCSEVYGLDFRMDQQAVPIKGGVMKFKNYRLFSKQEKNPLVVNGTLDLRQLANPQMNFAMQARNFELINSKRNKQSLAYGKVYTDFTGTVRGSLDEMVVRGNAHILPETSLTYILKDSPLSVDDRLNTLVKFVDFNDTTTTVEPEPVKRGQFDMVLGVSIDEAAKFHCDLGESGDNYVDVEGGGDLTLRMSEQDDMRLTGRLTVGEGTMKYTLPIISLKKFNIQRGSYVEFTGDALNPILNIVATENAKATVTENEVPRSVAFDVGVRVTQQLDNMGLEFIIDAPEDMGMQNQLAQMTPEQRAKTAVSLLATGMYLNDDMLSGGAGGLNASNALTAFLQSEIQNIAGQALRTVDLSVGLESGVSATGANTTDYSFQFAKRFWGNRVSVIIGGRVSTGEGATNTAESFIDKVAVEYRLDKSSSRYVRAFYDRGTRDPFEGQLTKTGVGLVLRRKTNRLGELFMFGNRKRKVPVVSPLRPDTMDTLSVKKRKRVVKEKK